MSLSAPLLRSIVTGINGQFIKNKPIDYFRGVIDQFSKDDYIGMLEDFKMSKRDRVSSYETLYNYGYSKYRLFNNNYYEINIIEWNQGAKSLIHNHSANGCIIKLIDGGLIEDIFSNPGNHDESYTSKIRPIKHTKRNIIVPIHSFNKTRTHSYYIDGFHRITNINNGKSYSLHFYAPPNFVPEVY